MKDEQESQKEITEVAPQAEVETSKAVMRSWLRDMVVSVLVSAFIIFSFCTNRCGCSGGDQYAAEVGGPGQTVH